MAWNYSPKAGGCGLYLGTHFIHSIGTNIYPKLALKFRAKVTATFTIGWCLVMVPVSPSGAFVRHPVTGSVDALMNGTVTSTAWQQQTPTPVALTAGAGNAWSIGSKTLTPVGGTSSASPTESGAVGLTSFYFGAYNTSGALGNPASIAGITLYLLAP